MKECKQNITQRVEETKEDNDKWGYGFVKSGSRTKQEIKLMWINSETSQMYHNQGCT